MRIKTRRKWDKHTLGLEVERPDLDGDVMISVRNDAFYIDQRDVPALIAALRWAIQPRKGVTKGPDA